MYFYNDLGTKIVFHNQQFENRFIIKLMKHDIDFSPWNFSKLKRANHYSKATCPKCGDTLSFGEWYRLRGKNEAYRYHLLCVAFIYSRYANVNVPDLSRAELELIDFYNKQVSAKALGWSYPQGN